MLVSVHDVSSFFFEELEQISNCLEPLIGKRFSLAVVPAWQGSGRCLKNQAYRKWLNQYRHEYLLHGYFHRRHQRGCDPVSCLTEDSNELSGLDRFSIRNRLSAGRLFMDTITGTRPRGFIPPAWQAGHMKNRDLESAGLRFSAGLFSIKHVNGGSRSLATWSWDCGRFACLGYMGHVLGLVLSINPAAVPCVVIHPRDLHRGWLNHALVRIRHLMNRGCHPARFEDLVPNHDFENGAAPQSWKDHV
jgi:hypothetical protein